MIQWRIINICPPDTLILGKFSQIQLDFWWKSYIGWQFIYFLKCTAAFIWVTEIIRLWSFINNCLLVEWENRTKLKEVCLTENIPLCEMGELNLWVCQINKHNRVSSMTSYITSHVSRRGCFLLNIFMYLWWLEKDLHQLIMSILG